MNSQYVWENVMKSFSALCHKHNQIQHPAATNWVSLLADLEVFTGNIRMLEVSIRDTVHSLDVLKRQRDEINEA